MEYIFVKVRIKHDFRKKRNIGQVHYESWKTKYTIEISYEHELLYLHKGYG